MNKINYTPYQILGVNEQAGDAEIKQAYLQRVKANPPDRDQQEFRRIQQAYEKIKDESSRLEYALFALPEVDFEQLLDHAFERGAAVPAMASEAFSKLFAEESIEKALAQAGRPS